MKNKKVSVCGHLWLFPRLHSLIQDRAKLVLFGFSGHFPAIESWIYGNSGLVDKRFDSQTIKDSLRLAKIWQALSGRVRSDSWGARVQRQTCFHPTKQDSLVRHMITYITQNTSALTFPNEFVHLFCFRTTFPDLLSVTPSLASCGARLTTLYLSDHPCFPHTGLWWLYQNGAGSGVWHVHALLSRCAGLLFPTLEIHIRIPGLPDHWGFPEVRVRPDWWGIQPEAWSHRLPVYKWSIRCLPSTMSNILFQLKFEAKLLCISVLFHSFV